MSLVLGLGNPGERYARTRHNVGWRVVEGLAGRWKARAHETTALYRSWQAVVAEREVVLLIPLTFMNASGAALASWLERHAAGAEGLLVVADDVYLPAGTLRVRERGSSGGHRGLESIEAALGGPDYARLRIGVGAAAGEGLRDHVLGEPEGDDERRLDEAIGLAMEAVECWAREGVLAAMNRFNRRAGKEVSEP